MTQQFKNRTSSNTLGGLLWPSAAEQNEGCRNEAGAVAEHCLALILALQLAGGNRNGLLPAG